MSSQTLTLNNGLQMPLVGHGLWKISNDAVADHVYNAIKAGYRLFDGACGKLFPWIMFTLVRAILIAFKTTRTSAKQAKASLVPSKTVL